MKETEVRDSVGFGCANCREDIDFCDMCKTMFDYKEQKIFCDEDESKHYCEDCKKLIDKS